MLFFLITFASRIQAQNQSWVSGIVQLAAKPFSLSIAFFILVSNCFAQQMAGVECTIKDMADQHCKWYVYNHHDKEVEMLLRKTTYWCHGREAKSYEFTRTVSPSPGKYYYIAPSREYCMVCDKPSSIVKISVISKNYVGSSQSTTSANNNNSSNSNDVSAPVNTVPPPNTSLGDMTDYLGNDIKFTNPNTGSQVSSPVSSNGYNYYVYGTPGVYYGYYDKTVNVDVWKELEKALGTLSPEQRKAFEPYLQQMGEALKNNDYGLYGELINKASANSGNTSNKVSPPNTSYGNMNDFLGNEIKFTNPNTGGQVSTPVSSGSNSNTNNANGSSTPVQQNQESYVLFWLKNNNDGYQNQAFIKLNGQLLAIKPGAGKALSETHTIPSCESKEYCDNIGFCSGVLKAKLTQTENIWDAEIINGTQKQGRFTAKPGCNIIEIK